MSKQIHGSWSTPSENISDEDLLPVKFDIFRHIEWWNLSDDMALPVLKQLPLKNLTKHPLTENTKDRHTATQFLIRSCKCFRW